MKRCVTKSKEKKEWYNGSKSKSRTVVRGAREEAKACRGREEI